MQGIPSATKTPFRFEGGQQLRYQVSCSIHKKYLIFVPHFCRFRSDGDTKEVVLQVRVNPAGTKIVKDPVGVYYVTPKPEDVRLYGNISYQTVGH